MRYLYRFLVAVSILFNVALGGASNQTFSARNYERKRQGKSNLTTVIDFVLGKDHCLHSWANWMTRK